MRVKGFVFVLGIIFHLGAVETASACAWELRISRFWGGGEKPDLATVLGNIKGALDYIEANPGSESGTPEAVQALTVDLRKAHQQILDSLSGLAELMRGPVLAQQVFSELADRVLMSDSFIKSLRFLTSKRIYTDEVWEVWDDELQKLSKLLDRHLPKDTAEGVAARKVLSLWGQPNTYWSMKIHLHCLRLVGLGETESKLYQEWTSYRASTKRSTDHLKRVWKGFSSINGIFESTAAIKPVAPPPLSPTAKVSGSIGNGSLVEDLKDEIDASSGVVSGPKKDSGIRKPGAGRTEKQKLAFMTQAERIAAKSAPPSFYKPESVRPPNAGGGKSPPAKP